MCSIWQVYSKMRVDKSVQADVGVGPYIVGIDTILLVVDPVINS